MVTLVLYTHAPSYIGSDIIMTEQTLLDHIYRISGHSYPSVAEIDTVGVEGIISAYRYKQIRHSLANGALSEGRLNAILFDVDRQRQRIEKAIKETT